MRLWILSAGTVVAAVTMGVSLGAYVTQTPVSPLAGPAQAAAPEVETDIPVAPFVADAAQEPREIHCKGCGPTLAERRWMRDMAGTQATAPEPVIDLDFKVEPLPDATSDDPSGRL